MSSKNTRQNPEYREALIPTDRLEQFSDDGKMVRFPGSCQFTLDRNARAGFSTLLCLDKPGQVKLNVESGVTLVNQLDTLQGEGAAAVLVCSRNDDGRSAKFLLQGEGIGEYNDTTPWTAQVSSDDTVFWLGHVWASELGLWVMVGTKANAPQIATSTDGVTWTAQATASDVTGLFDVCWSADLGLLVAVGQRSNAGDFILTSSDAVNWVTQSAPFDAAGSRNLRGVVWSSTRGLFIAVGNAGIVTSPDGVNWTLQTSPAVPITEMWLEQISDAPELGIIVVTGDNGVGFDLIYSYNAVDWFVTPTPDDVSVGYLGIAYSPQLRRFVICDDFYFRGIPFLWSDDGLTWHDGELSGAGFGADYVIWIAELGLFVASTDEAAGKRMAVSVDGKAWTFIEAANDAEHIIWTKLSWSPTLGKALCCAYPILDAPPILMTSNPL